MTEPTEIKGWWTCDCHPFKSFDEAKKASIQKFTVGDEVQNRCDKKLGIVHEINERNYVIVKYGPRAYDLHLEHCQELIKLKTK